MRREKPRMGSHFHLAHLVDEAINSMGHSKRDDVVWIGYGHNGRFELMQPKSTFWPNPPLFSCSALVGFLLIDLNNNDAAYLSTQSNHQPPL
jgi:hypothetical protein